MGSVAVLAVVVLSGSAQAAGGGHSFTTLEDGFTQDIVGTIPSFMGGVAFATDGDPIVDHCSFSGSPLDRFDLQGATSEVHGTTLYPVAEVSSNAGCGLTSHPDGTLYTNTGSGVVNLNPDTGAQIRGPFGPAGNALGIAVDPQTGNLVYVASDATIHYVDDTFANTGTFSSATSGRGVDGIFFNPTGEFLFLAQTSPTALTILGRDGSILQEVPAQHQVDGIAFHAADPKFVLTNNTDGTITRYDFPQNDFSQAPTQSTFASGGFRGDLAQVGSDGCLYLSQEGTRYNDDTTSGDNSLVRICSGFSPPAGVTHPEGPHGDATCSDGIDNDGDGNVDGADSDCAAPASEPPPAPAEQAPPPAAPSNPASPPERGPKPCLNDGHNTFHLHHGPRTRVIEARVYVNGKLVKTQKSQSLTTLTIDFHFPSTGMFVVKIEVTHSNGSRIVSERTYANCTKTPPKVHSHRHGPRRKRPSKA